MKVFFPQGRGYKAICRELSGVLGEAAVSLMTVRSWCKRFKAGKSSFDDENRLGQPLSSLAHVISPFLRGDPFLSALILAKRLVTSSHTIKEIIARDMRMRKFMRR
jgi:hypothetical protein